MSTQPELFAEGPEVEHLDLPDADIALHPRFFELDTADRLFTAIDATTAWRQDEVTMYGRRTPIPRLQAWYGEPGATYTYSALRMEPLPWTPALAEIREALTARLGTTFNSVLCNQYRGGNDSVAWHADDEPELGPQPVIASVSLGAVRRFSLRHVDDPDLRHDLDLPHGSVVVMQGPTQSRWRHAIPKTARPVGPRINLTFRSIQLPTS